MARELNLAASNTHAIVKITCPTAEVASTLATALVESGSAACVNLIGAVTSVYRWQGAIEKDSEVLLLVKTTFKRKEQLLRVVADHHPYEVPEVLWSPVTFGSKSYLDWVTQSMASEE